MTELESGIGSGDGVLGASLRVLESTLQEKGKRMALASQMRA